MRLSVQPIENPMARTIIVRTRMRDNRDGHETFSGEGMTRIVSTAVLLCQRHANEPGDAGENTVTFPRKVPCCSSRPRLLQGATHSTRTDIDARTMRDHFQRIGLALMVAGLSLALPLDAAAQKNARPGPVITVPRRTAPLLKNTPVTAVYHALRDDDGDSLPDALNQTFTLRGVLTLRPFMTNEIWYSYFQDDTAALRLADKRGRRANKHQAGDEVLVRGVLEHAEMDELQIEDIQRVHDGEVPRPRNVWASELHNN